MIQFQSCRIGYLHLSVGCPLFLVHLKKTILLAFFLILFMYLWIMCALALSLCFNSSDSLLKTISYSLYSLSSSLLVLLIFNLLSVISFSLVKYALIAAMFFFGHLFEDGCFGLCSLCSFGGVFACLISVTILGCLCL